MDMRHAIRRNFSAALVLPALLLAGCGKGGDGAAVQNIQNDPGTIRNAPADIASPFTGTAGSEVDGPALRGFPGAAGAAGDESMEESPPGAGMAEGWDDGAASHYIPGTPDDGFRGAATMEPPPGAGVAGGGEGSPALQNIPGYPGAVRGEYMEGAEQVLDMFSGELAQYSTGDSHDAVLAFYTDALSSHRTQVSRSDLPGGHKAVISFVQDGDRITIGIQERRQEGRVVITHMRAGNAGR